MSSRPHTGALYPWSEKGPWKEVKIEFQGRSMHAHLEKNISSVLAQFVFLHSLLISQFLHPMCGYQKLSYDGEPAVEISELKLSCSHLVHLALPLCRRATFRPLLHTFGMLKIPSFLQGGCGQGLPIPRPTIWQTRLLRLTLLATSVIVAAVSFVFDGLNN